MKKLLSGIIAALLAVTPLSPTAFAAGEAAADTVRYEGENYQSVNGFTPYPFAKNPECSNEQMTGMYRSGYANGVPHTLSYTVNVPQAGTYSITAATSKVGVTFTSKYYVSVNGGEEVCGDKGEFIENVKNSQYVDTMAKYNLGEFVFKGGVNTVTFSIPEPRALNNDGWYVFFLDYFEIGRDTKSRPIKTIAPRANLGVFKEGEQVTYDVTYGYTDDQSHQLQLSLVNYWGEKIIDNQTLTVPPYARELPLYLGTLKNGWYSMEIQDDGKVLAQMNFTVIPPTVLKKTDETPFAMDFAGAWLVDADKVENYAKAIKLAGINWTRDRFRWRDIEPQKGKYTFEGTDKAIEAVSKQGINISNVFHDSPSWAKDNSATFCDDLFDIYNFMKTTAAHYADQVSAWEMWNEPDSPSYNVEPTDRYAAFVKAGLLGVSASGAKAVKAPAGYSHYPPHDTPMPDLAMQNGIANYSDVYNFHAYSPYSGGDLTPTKEVAIRAHQSLSVAYDPLDSPLWITETGMFIPGPNKDAWLENGQRQDLTSAAALARFTVTKQVQELAMGASKVFWFVLPAYSETQNLFGMFDFGDQPYPSFTAEAVMTHTLGKAKYKGIVKGLSDGAFGYVFDTGAENDVAVMWSDKTARAQFKSADPVIMTDLMGEQKTLYPNKCGYVTLAVNKDPVFVTFPGRCDAGDYYAQEYKERELEINEFTDAEKIVLQQNCGNNIADFKGYVLNSTAPNEMKIEVYNFNDKEMTGTIRGRVDDSLLTIQPASQTVTVPAMSKGIVTFTVNVKAEAPLTGRSVTQFIGEFDGQPTTPTVASVSYSKQAEPTALFAGADNANNWDTRNVTKGASASAENTEDGVSFKLSFNGGNMNTNWFYPFLDVKDPSVFENTKGLTFSVYVPYDSGKHTMNVFLYYNDSADTKYYVGTGYGLMGGWRQIYIPWEMFQRYSHPDDLGTVDLSRVKQISVGVNSAGAEVPTYTIKNVGCYNVEGASVVTDARRERVTLSGITDKSVVQSDNLKLTAQISDNTDVASVKVFVSDKEYPFTRTGNTITIDLDGLKTGAYQVIVAVYTPDGYAVRDDVTFKVK